MPIPLSYPGVYIQEVASGVRTITGVATSITAFSGRTNKGPLNRAVRCLSYADFVRFFGGSPVGSELALSVKQFYDNGGSDCYVVRLARAGTARRAAVTLRNFGLVDVLVVTAKVEGLWGNGLRLEVDYNTPNPGETFNLKVLLEEGGRLVTSELFSGLSMDRSSARYAPTLVSQSSELVDVTLGAGLGDPSVAGSTYNVGSFPGFSEGRRPLGPDGNAIQAVLDALIHPVAGFASHSFDISVNGLSYVTVNLSDWVVPNVVGTLESELETRINQALQSLVPAPAVTVTLAASAQADNERFLRITAADAGGVEASVKVRRASANDLAAALMLGADNGGVELARRGDFRPAPTGTVIRYEAGTDVLTRLNDLAGLDQPGLTSIAIDGGAPISLTTALQTTAAGDAWFENAAGGLATTGDRDGVREKLRRMAQAISGTAGLRYKAEVHGYSLVLLAKDGTINQTPAVVLAGAGAGVFTLQANVRQYALGDANGTASPFVNDGAVVVGSDGDAPLFADYVGDPVPQTGFHALDTVDLFNLMVVPRDEAVPADQRFAIWGAASLYCRSRRAFLIIDAPDNWTSNGRPSVVQNTALVNDLRATVVKDHSAVYYPKVRINDGGIVRAIGSSGAVAGLMARTDAARGVWKAPAGTEADLRGLAGLEVKLTDLENGVLNKLGVNCARSFVSGYVNWGARTMDGADDIGSEWKYVPIRRLALFLEESLYRGTQWVVFEPNDEPLWARIRLNVGAFMNGLFRQGAFQGSTPNQAFYVKCDAETTTQADRNLGIVNIEVGFAPLKPAEFVILKIQQIAGDLA